MRKGLGVRSVVASSFFLLESPLDSGIGRKFGFMNWSVPRDPCYSKPCILDPSFHHPRRRHGLMTIAQQMGTKDVSLIGSGLLITGATRGAPNSFR